MRAPLFCLAFMVAATTCQAAVITEYTNVALFTSLLRPGFFQSNFSTLGAGTQAAAAVTINAGAPVVGVNFSSRNATDTGAGRGLYVMDTAAIPKALSLVNAGDTLTVASSFNAIGGNWFLSNTSDAFSSGAVTLTFNDGTSFTVNSTTLANSFRGYISDTPLTLVNVKPATTGSGRFASIDNLLVAPVPEPTGLICLLTSLTLVGLRRRR